jgi:YVTN family beta-propeller protein
MKRLQAVFGLNTFALLALLEMGAPVQAAPFAYIPNFGGNTVSVIDTATNDVIHTIVVGNAPNGVALNPKNGHAYVTNRSDNTVSVIDTTAQQVTATIAVGIGPIGVVLHPNGINPSHRYPTSAHIA